MVSLAPLTNAADQGQAHKHQSQVMSRNFSHRNRTVTLLSQLHSTLELCEQRGTMGLTGSAVSLKEADFGKKKKKENPSL